MNALHRAKGKGDFALWAESSPPPKNHLYRWQVTFLSSFTTVYTQKEDNLECRMTPLKMSHTHTQLLDITVTCAQCKMTPCFI